MTKVIQAGEFFIVGGPVQPDRPCYIERVADQLLLEAVREQRFCHVLAPRASGKSSLMARAIRELRAEAYLAAVVDLGQIGARGESADPGRWYYSIAYRIVRELRLRIELQTWWQEKSALMSEQRLAEFFWEIVLTHTTSQVVIFFDEIERAQDVPFSHELFAAIRGCYTNRSTESDYSRLNFVVLGTAAPSELCPDSSASPFEIGRPLELPDFTLEETYGLAPGFEGGGEQSRALLERIYGWTSGHPYLTQKVARGVVRRGGRLEAVERTVREQYLAPSAQHDEPLLAHIRSMLTARAAVARQSLAVLGKIARGVVVKTERGSRTQEFLVLSGVVKATDDAQLVIRNQIFAKIFDTRWVHAAQPFEWPRLTRFAALAVALLAVPIWYVEYLPRPYLNTLSVATEDVAVAEEAYQKLHRLPGFAGRADQLMAEMIERRSRQAERYSDVVAADARLRQLPGRAALADTLLGEYWLRRAHAAMRDEERDSALLFASRALGSNETARPLVAELVDDDYNRLDASVRLSQPPAYWEVDWDAEMLTLVDRAHRAERLHLRRPAADVRAFPERLTAVQHVPVVRELTVDAAGSAGAFTLELVIEHGAPEQLMLTLEAPSGARANLELPGARQDPRYRIVAGAGSALASLADEERRGTWRLTVIDRRIGTVGTLRQWALRFDDEPSYASDAPEQGVPIPDPVRTDQVDLVLADDGRLAVTEPARTGAVGALGVWDLTTGQRRVDLELDAVPDFLAFADAGQRLLAVTGDALTAWNLETGQPAARLVAQNGFLRPPIVGVDGDFVAIAEPFEGGSALYSILAADDGRLVASVEAQSEVTGWLLGPQGGYLALLGPPRVVRIIEPRRGEVRYQLDHQRDVVRMLGVPHTSSLLTIDAAGDIQNWSLMGTGSALTPHLLGRTMDPESVSVSADGSMVAFEAELGHVVARDVTGARERIDVRVDRAGGPVRTRLAPAGNLLLTISGTQSQLWRLDGTKPAANLATAVSALALGKDAARVAIGFRSGQVELSTPTDLGRAAANALPVDYIGHQGAVTCLALDADVGLAASGGEDGVARIWDLASAAPRAPFMRHPAGPVRSVALSPDGRWLASAAEYSARLWRISDGSLTTEVPVNGAALALAFAPDSSVVAVGDTAGNVFFAAPDGASNARPSLRAAAPISALAFAPDGGILASGDESGQVALWNPLTGARLGEPRAFRHAVRWLAFSADGTAMVVQTAHWAHRLTLGESGLVELDSHLLPTGLEAGAAFLAGAERLEFVGVGSGGAPRAYELDTTTGSVAASVAASLDRDWPAVLGIDLDASGRVVPRLR